VDCTKPAIFVFDAPGYTAVFIYSYKNQAIGKIKPPQVEQFAILTPSRMGNRSYKLLVGSS